MLEVGPYRSGLHGAAPGIAGNGGPSSVAADVSRGMLIINADDWGGWRSATDAALSCFEAGRITSATAMVFMEDSERAAGIARVNSLETGLHLNFNQEFTSSECPPAIRAVHDRVRRYLRSNKYTQLVYNPFLRRDFRALFEAQLEEFCRLYGRPPSHFDGHQHMHLCANMLVNRVIPKGEKVRTSFTFWPREKGFANRTYRRLVVGRLAGRYRLTRYFFALSQCLRSERFARVVELARAANVELMTHPEKHAEHAFLMSNEYPELIGGLRTGSYAAL